MKEVFLVLPINSIERNLEVEVYSVSDLLWKEKVVTKNSSPTISNEPILTTFVSSDAKDLKINVTELVKNSNNDIFSIALNVKSEGSKDYITFYSKEKEEDHLKPHLEVSKETVVRENVRKRQLEKETLKETLNIEIYPTYFDQDLNLKVNNIEGDVLIQIYDLYGRLISKDNRRVSKYENVIDISSLVRGAKSGSHYIVTLINNGLKKNYRIYKK